MKQQQGQPFSIKSKLHPPRQKDLTKFSTWLRDARDFARDHGVRGVSEIRYWEMFRKGMLPREAASTLADDPRRRTKSDAGYEAFCQEQSEL